MAPSQLAQLKAALNTSGLSRQSKSKKTQNAKGRAGLTAKDREKKQKKLEQIKDTLNRFDVREEKVKNPVVGKVQKSKTGGGLPSQSRQKGLEMRRETLLPELQSRRAGHTGTFVDRRFGEANPSITPEERALERFTRTREASGRTGKKSVFNLNDDDAGGLGFGDDDGDMHLGSSSAGFTLTHGGRSIDSLKGDDFAAQGLDEEDLDDDFGINREVEGEEGAVERQDRRVHFGGGSEDGEEVAGDVPERKRSKAEIMAEVVAKSKSYKYERQQQKELDEDLRMELDEGLDDLRELLAASAPKKAKTNIEYYKPAEANVAKPAVPPVVDAPVTTKLAAPQPEDMDYDQHVRALAFDRRAKPKDRTKTEEEMIKDEVERLREAEQARLKRMRGEEDEEEAPNKRRRKGKERAPEGDDLEDDLDYEDDNEAKEFGLGEGIGGPSMVNLGPDSEAEDQSGDEEGSGEEDEEDEEDDEEEDDDELEEKSEIDDLASDLDDDLSAEEEDEDVDVDAKPSNPIKIATKSSGPAKRELPFTFPCPEDYEQFLDLIEGLEIAEVETVVKRIRTLHHPSLAEGNKERLQGFLGILLDHVLAASPSYDSFALVAALTPHISALVALNPLTAAECFKEIVGEMHETFDENLKKATSKAGSSSWPDMGELAILRLIGLLWSTSDFSHPVSAPSTLYMGQQLSQGRLKSLSDVTAGLFLVSLFLQYEAISKKVIPEALNFLGISILSLAPSSLDLDPVPGSFPLGQILKAPSMQLQSKIAKDMDINKPDLVELLQANAMIGEDAEQAKLDLLGLALDLVGRFAEYYAESAAFIELFQPFFEIIFSLSTAKVPASVKTTCKALSAKLGKMLSVSGKSRKPLSMQSHRPIPIATYTPKFDAEFNRGKRVDPDSERNEAAKLKAQYKKERKGAIRELRKDARFIAGERVKEQKQKDHEYEKRMRSVVGSIATTERAEEKAAEREKSRDKRRAGRK